MEDNASLYAILTEDINRVRCPYCARIVHVKIGTSGTKDCPYCNKQFILPENDAEAVSEEDFVDIECPFCGSTVSVDAALGEQEVICPFCDAMIEYHTDNVLTNAAKQLTFVKLDFLEKELGVTQEEIAAFDEDKWGEVYDYLCDVEVAEVPEDDDEPESERCIMASDIVTLLGNAIAEAGGYLDEDEENGWYDEDNE